MKENDVIIGEQNLNCEFKENVDGVFNLVQPFKPKPMTFKLGHELKGEMSIGN